MPDSYMIEPAGQVDFPGYIVACPGTSKDQQIKIIPV